MQRQRDKVVTGTMAMAALAAMLALELALGLAPAMAQPPAPPTLDQNGACLPDEQMWGGVRPDPRRVQEAAGQTIAPATPLFRGFDLRERVAGPDIPFGSNILVFREVAGSPPRALIRDNTTSRCGWINAELRARYRAQLRLPQIPGYESEVTDTGRPNRLVAKVVVRNVTNERGEMLQVPVFVAPFDTSRPAPPEISRVGYFAVLDVFEVQNARRERCGSIQDADCFYLVGGARDTPSGSVFSILGWVRTGDVSLWPSAISIYYAPSRPNVPIFPNERDARDNRVQSAIAVQEQPVAEPRERNIPRFPVIVRSRGAGQTREADIYQIVFAGRACLDAACSRTITGEQNQLDVGRFGEAVYRSEGIDVLFVVDGTQSMTRYYQPVIEAVQSTAARAQREGLRMRFSVVAYGDYVGRVGNTQTVQIVTVAPFRAVNEAGAVVGLNRLQTFQDEQRDYPEAPFAALVRAVSEAQWGRPETTALNLVIWIGDHGNREPGPNQTRSAAGTLDEQVTVEHVVTAMRRDPERLVAFTALNVRGDYRPEFNELFRRNARDIIQRLGPDRTMPLVVVEEAASQQSEASAVRSAIERHLGEIMATSAQIVRHIRGGVRSDSTATTLDESLPSARLARAYLQQVLRISDTQLREFSGRIQQIRTGFVVQDEQSPNFRFWLALRPRERAELYDAMRQLCESMERTEVVDEVGRAMRAVLQAVTFEEIQPTENPNIAEFLERALSVPRRKFAPILNQTLAEYVRAYFNMPAAQQAVERTRVCRRMVLLELVQDNIRVAEDDIVFENSRWGIRRNATRERFQWNWTVDGSVSYFFVPLEFLP